MPFGYANPDTKPLPRDYWPPILFHGSQRRQKTITPRAPRGDAADYKAVYTSVWLSMAAKWGNYVGIVRPSTLGSDFDLFEGDEPEDIEFILVSCGGLEVPVAATLSIDHVFGRDVDRAAYGEYSLPMLLTHLRGTFTGAEEDRASAILRDVMKFRELHGPEEATLDDYAAWVDGRLDELASEYRGAGSEERFFAAREDAKRDPLRLEREACERRGRKLGGFTGWRGSR